MATTEVLYCLVQCGGGIGGKHRVRMRVTLYKKWAIRTATGSDTGHRQAMTFW